MGKTTGRARIMGKTTGREASSSRGSSCDGICFPRNDDRKQRGSIMIGGGVTVFAYFLYRKQAKVLVVCGDHDHAVSVFLFCWSTIRLYLWAYERFLGQKTIVVIRMGAQTCEPLMEERKVDGERLADAENHRKYERDHFFVGAVTDILPRLIHHQLQHTTWLIEPLLKFKNYRDR